ncbi:cbb3-type cytochrome oxidase assembly protein CcoS [Marinobacter sp. TBZ242]|uniref:Cbb3-type cytochrome oxidase assembly protein CcoS n=1 Tax=Marinobacter azerbaijanicus TaxID=3050455 RepID=A0ABT7I6W7_9GAMM|nr:cbb3-type cytochrome oxidase assembly protein CcoS [Marinobacter sp. TBZ242]MDL0429877.1 cbb3-type cytochrome oxidase assembly protein CcoS [Marinobacter sp. TBZ242]
MKIVMILVPVMLILVALGIVLFSWAVKSGQYDDLDGPAHRILYDDDKDMIPDDAKQPGQESASRNKSLSKRNAADEDPGDDQTS